MAAVNWMDWLQNLPQSTGMGTAMMGANQMGGPPPPMPFKPGQPAPISTGGPAPGTPGINPGGPEIFGAPAARPDKALTQDQMQASLLGRLGEIEPQERMAKRQRAMAEALRGGGKFPAIRETGRTVQAAHPLEAVASLMNAGMGAYTSAQADKTEDDYAKARAQAFKNWRNQPGVGF